MTLLCSPPYGVKVGQLFHPENKLTLMTLIDISNPRRDSIKSKLEFLINTD